ncbi:HIT domain-containing protein [Rheinheimera salexigens]|uniref:Histidine triad (HIT) protein n=1 Tax=Rheinheimera salexigens TaxID=1628148 RepID=A0A1E7Q4K3_9GAMM|nr:HIT domain-containing protein [Rheinheimera salexigens]OEY69079.1 histidine triad (HIT) protein [Rheinheimera salexigens]
MNDEFTLDPRLANDSIYITDLALCQIRLNNDSRYPWFILIPKLNNISEIIDLSPQQQQQLWQESAALSFWLKKHYKHAKLNVAALGNVVAQLHIHHIVRFVHDDAWPAPVWGKFPAIGYTEEAKTTLKHQFLQTFLFP